jgi:hypothetical protein
VPNPQRISRLIFWLAEAATITLTLVVLASFCSLGASGLWQLLNVFSSLYRVDISALFAIIVALALVSWGVRILGRKGVSGPNTDACAWTVVGLSGTQLLLLWFLTRPVVSLVFFAVMAGLFAKG